MQSAPVLSTLVDSLARLPGRFVLTQNDVWDFEGSTGLFDAIGEYGDSAVVRLVDCLDRESPATATVNGHAVPVGVMCSAALKFIAYYEPPASARDESLAESWAGDLQPTASASQLRAAKEAWLAVIRNHSYHLS